jgi:hypothetical protein
MSVEQLYRQAKPLCATQREERPRDRKGSNNYICVGQFNNSKKHGLLSLLLFHDDSGHRQNKLMTSTLTNVDRLHCDPISYHFLCSEGYQFLCDPLYKHSLNDADL